MKRMHLNLQRFKFLKDKICSFFYLKHDLNLFFTPTYLYIYCQKLDAIESSFSFFFCMFLLKSSANEQNLGGIASFKMWFPCKPLPKVKSVLLLQTVHRQPTCLSNSIN